MMNFLKLIPLVCLLHLATSAPKSSIDISNCSYWTQLKFGYKCRSLVFDALVYEKPTVSVEHDSKFIDGICEKADSCLNDFDCDDIKRLKSELSSACEIVHYALPDNELCIKEFLRKAYMSQFSNEDSCFKEYPFLDKDLARKRDAYLNGKLCFIKYARDYCTSATLEYFDADKYQKFAESMSSTPVSSLNDYNKKCQDPQSVLNAIECQSLIAEYNVRVEKLKSPEYQSNNDFVMQSRKVCRDAETCIVNSCIMTKDQELRTGFSHNCRVLDTQYPR